MSKKIGKPKPNADKEYLVDVTPCTNGKMTLYDLSRYLEPYHCRGREDKLSRVRHVIAGRTATVYLIDDYKILNRQQAIVFAGRFVQGDYDTYRLD